MILALVAAGGVGLPRLVWARIPNFSRTSTPEAKGHAADISTAGNVEPHHSVIAEGIARPFFGPEIALPGPAADRLRAEANWPWRTHPLEHFQVAGLDRLLWIHLRLLFTQFALYRFLNQTSAEQIQADIKRLEGQLAQTSSGRRERPGPARTQGTRRQSANCRDRLANLQRARDNFDLVKLEIDRLENKIQSLSEMAVNRQEPDYISGQVDQVATSMLETEKTMNELRFVTGLETVDDTPELMRGDLGLHPKRSSLPKQGAPDCPPNPPLCKADRLECRNGSTPCHPSPLPFRPAHVAGGGDAGGGGSWGYWIGWPWWQITASN